MKKAVFIVLAVTLLAFGIATSAMAIDGLAPGISYVNPGGLGDSLVYGYYNVRGNLNLFNIVNTTNPDGEKVRVVFRAGKTSEEVLDFSVCLSMGDVWTAYLIDNGTTAAICPFDTDTITAPTIPAGCQAFKIPSNSTLTNDDLKEGYFEVLGLSSIPDYDHNATRPVITDAAACANWGTSANIAAAGDVGNVLMGNNTIINFTDLDTYSYNATAIGSTRFDAFADPGPGSELSLPQVSVLTCGIEVNLAKTSIKSPFDVMGGLGAETELILTFPTRLKCHGSDAAASTINNLGGGTGNLFKCTKNATGGACTAYETPINVAAWDDQENTQNILQFSPAGADVVKNEVNVLKINSSNIWNSSLAQTLTVSVGDLGWIDIDLTGGNAAPTGLPVLSYTTQSFAGGAATYMERTAYTSFFNPAN